MISRRPNKRASRDKTPGPSGIRAAEMAVTRTVIQIVSARFENGKGSDERAIPTAPNPETPPATGVRNPVRRQAPVTRAATPISQASGAGWRDVTRSKP